MKNFLLLFFVLIFSTNKIFSQVKLPALVRDSMVLQRDAPVKIWGWASPKEKIKVQFHGKKYKTTADEKGNWRITMTPMKAGGPFMMKIDAKNHITLHDVLLGDVWLCSGQSNMEHYMALHKYTYAKEIAHANNSQIRQFLVPHTTNLQQPENDLPGGYWKSTNPHDILRFSAVAYFFAKALNEKYHVPIGIINSSVGGSPIEAWLSEDATKQFPPIEKVVEQNKDTAYLNETIRKANAINFTSRERPENDEGLSGKTKWFDTSYVPKEWYRISIPGYWEDQGVKDLDGVVWYRKEINIPSSMAGKAATLFMGRIVDADYVYVNGNLVGNTTYMYPERRYGIPEGLLKAGKNLVVVRVINYAGKGGFVPDKPYCIFAGKDTVELQGYWQYKVGEVFDPNRETAQPIVIQYQPTALYNAMIAPFKEYALKGVLWYQGESNSSNADEYAQLLKGLIKDWRSNFNQPDLPFIYVQLPGFMDVNYWPVESDWAVLREAQFKTLSVPNTGMAVTIDLGEWNDVHPLDKKNVGDRSALAAEKVAYRENNIVYSGPLYQSSKSEGNKIIITFNNVGSGLTSNDDEPLRRFEIAGQDKKFVWANAKIEGNNVIVWSDKISNPKYVRYAWSDNPRGANLYNKEGLPASPFETDPSGK